LTVRLTAGMIIYMGPDVRQTGPFMISRKSLLILMLLNSMALLAGACRRFMIKRIIISKKLEGINLSGLDFYNANLENINLSRAQLVQTNFSFSNLTNAKLTNADLRQADLSAANLSGADLRGANLRNATLRNATLKKANLVEAYLYDADLSDADLRDAVLVVGVADGSDMNAIRNELVITGLVQYLHVRNADMAGAAVSMKWKQFIQQQGVRNFDKIIWVK